MTTRPRNTTAHPGKVVLENTRARRDKEEIQHEKDLKRAAKAAKEKKAADATALKAVGRAFVHAEDAAAVTNAKKDVPRHRGMGSLLINP
jgi:isoaspartyl peptidase/L-asparaginase-like protein (Ntn-hydrolase superfamily)